MTIKTKKLENTKIMSSSVCHAPLPARMEAFTTRICLRAVDHYERLLQSHFNKTSNGAKKEASRLTGGNNNNNNTNNKNNNNKRDSSSLAKEQNHRRSHKDAAKTYSALNAFRQWRRNSSVGSKSAGPTTPAITAFGWPPSDSISLKKLERFPNVLTDTATPDEDLSLKFLALNALDLTAPASDVLLKNRLKSWFQLSGHPESFAPAGPGTVWKRRTGGPENSERNVYEALSKDKAMKDWIPRYYREVEYKNDTFIELQDLLFGFSEPHVVDIKMGTRTFLESEVSKTTARRDLYQKMIAVDPGAPTALEHEQKAVTKLRYMQFREHQSSTCSHGFRIEAMKLPGGPPITDLKKVKSHQEVLDTLNCFLGNRKDTQKKLLEKLRELRRRVETSEYFQTHEVIGSSVFMIYDNNKVGVWLIDFAKTYQVPKDIKLSHRCDWKQGNHEEGFLFGLDKLISVFEEINGQ